MMNADAEKFGGPFNVDLSKPYKPVFILFVDLIFAVTFLVFTLLSYWNDLDYQQPINELSTFLPLIIVLYLVILFLKFFLNAMYLIFCFEESKLNRSSSTGSLFWFRVAFDLILIGGFMFSYGNM